jgi:hypothetical protein
MLIAKLNEAKTHKCEWQIRSHVHYFVQIRYGSHGALSTPAWEVRSPYIIRKNPEDVPDIGAIRFTHVDNQKLMDLELMEWIPPKPALYKV